MKHACKVLFAAVIFILAGQKVLAQGTVTGYLDSRFRPNTEEKVVEHRYDFFLQKKINSQDKWGLFLFTQYVPTQDNYRQAYGGLYREFFSGKLQAGAGVGAESVGAMFRKAGWIAYDDKYFTGLFIVEHGPSGRWNFATASYKINPCVKLGYHGEALLGQGPRLDVCLPKTPISFYVAPLFRQKEQSTTFALRINF